MLIHFNQIVWSAVDNLAFVFTPFIQKHFSWDIHAAKIRTTEAYLFHIKHELIFA